MGSLSASLQRYACSYIEPTMPQQIASAEYKRFHASTCDDSNLGEQCFFLALDANHNMFLQKIVK